MKRAILCAIAMLTGGFSFAQEKIKEGKIVYSVEYQLPENLKAYAAFFPKEAVIYFRGDSAISVQKSAQSTNSMVTNTKTSFMRMLIDGNGRQFQVNFTPADQEEAMMSLPEYEYIAGTETQTMAGYKAIKYQLKDKKTGALMDTWFTKDISIPQNSLTLLFDPSVGVPLVFSTSQSGMIIKATIKEFKAEPVPAGTFSTPVNYQPITLQQFKAMMGGR